MHKDDLRFAEQPAFRVGTVRVRGHEAPVASSPAIRARMQTTRQRDTPIEVALRRELHRRGLRFYVDREPLRGWRRRADIVFPGVQIAVFVDGCFWHACPEHGTWPKSNADWWREKIEANVRRDRDTDSQLVQAGWLSIRVWGHEDPIEAASRIEDRVRRRRADAGPGRSSGSSQSARRRAEFASQPGTRDP
jgi:DNA mismatch endonuclease, patch repair protein